MKALPLKHPLAWALTAVIAGCGGSSSDDSSDGAGSTSTNVISINLSRHQFTEGPSTKRTEIAIPIRLSKRATKDVDVHYVFEDVDALNGVDYEADGGTITIPKGNNRGEILVQLIGDDMFEQEETFKVRITGSSAGEIHDRDSVQAIAIRNDDDPPELQLPIANQFVAETAGTVLVPITLSSISGTEVTATVTLSGTALEGGDYQVDTLNGKSITIPPGQSRVNLPIRIIPDSIPEGGETIVVAFSGSDNASIETTTSHTVAIQGDLTLNDTGLIQFSSGTTMATSRGSLSGQDGEYGRDIQFANNQDGHAGFSFTKLDYDGNPLPSASTSWTCVRDNVTGLIWENKSADADISQLAGHQTDETDQSGEPPFSWRAGNFVYGWRKEVVSDAGGSYGILRTSANQLDKEEPWKSKDNSWLGCAFKSSAGRSFALHCDTKSYSDEMNLKGVCGFDDWRMPEVSELRSIANYNGNQTGSVLPDRHFFSNMTSDIPYLSGTPSADNEVSAWCFDYHLGHVQLCQKATQYQFVAVRSAK